MVAWGHLTLKYDYLFIHYSAIIYEKEEDRYKNSIVRKKLSPSTTPLWGLKQNVALY